ncbi:hypothetical protein CONPUDRAFT_83495 [Coniophora puteana RWD-64-598 SS2]|uniref:Uncharacterized protein n=1 Tax=Coniophora puteana (strain RWD-64-598) TaxID=741705 RepID=A0A5M3MJ22_CONPW|nr:uncharacterized protein CONPUDRAFT_83495 [Coniophora puteana RWD-64-598 SS2]EIW79212.1 hypothetical protein CONPUDRAFT_83495 [Coniophora puteana RWD-64-598 SS2]
MAWGPVTANAVRDSKTARPQRLLASLPSLLRFLTYQFQHTTILVLEPDFYGTRSPLSLLAFCLRSHPRY